MSDEPTAPDREEVAQSLAAIRAEDAELSDVLCLVGAALALEAPIVPRELIDAIQAKWATDGDYANGGADQFVWNHGVEPARQVADAWREVGAIENAELLERLADALCAYREEVAAEEIAAHPVDCFLAYRKRVNGPFFGIPEPGDELAECLVEWAIEHAGSLPNPDRGIPGFDDPSASAQ